MDPVWTWTGPVWPALTGSPTSCAGKRSSLTHGTQLPPLPLLRRGGYSVTTDNRDYITRPFPKSGFPIGTLFHKVWLYALGGNDSVCPCTNPRHGLASTERQLHTPVRVLEMNSLAHFLQGLKPFGSSD